MDGRHFQRLVEGERRENAREPARHHGLARAGRADHQRVVPAGGGDLQRPSRERLPVDVREVAVHRECRHGRQRRGRLGRGERNRVVQGGDGLDQ
jgi:hypothetical protein